ncbi:hypothetical protein ACIGEO_16300 [Stenotrophomonas bentonitica]|uniref:hypothetical protein n=1 Tax=Stenotrophomonas bentonitica TaxID=1450134 RepID=UPI0037D65A8F
MPRPLRIASLAIAALIGALAIVGATTHGFSNAWMMLTDSSNVIPAESSILSFESYVINPGSSNYWLYGKDRTNYYHFVHTEQALYVYLPIKNSCPRFDRENIRTWCNVRIGTRH